MENDFLKDLKFLGMAARLKRLSDTLSASIKDLYKERGIDIEPSWHLIFLYLKKKETSTMSEIAEALHYSQPAVTKMINRMKKKGYLDVIRDENDTRKKNLRLSKNAKKRLPEFEIIWAAGQKSIQEILQSNTDFFNYLEHFESEIEKESFKNRALRNTNRSGNKK